MIGPDADRNTTLVEAVLEKFRDVHTSLGNYVIEIHEGCLGTNNALNSGISIVIFH